jgi:hypothetical protein
MPQNKVKKVSSKFCYYELQRENLYLTTAPRQSKEKITTLQILLL